MNKSKKILLILLIAITSFSLISSSTFASPNSEFQHSHNNKTEKKIKKQAKKELVKFKKKHAKNSKFNQTPRILDIEGDTWVYYDVKNSDTSFLGVQIDESTNKVVNTVGIITTEKKDSDNVHVTLTNNNETTGDFDINKDNNKLTNGWILKNNEKIDADKYQKEQELQPQPQVSSCLKSCLANSGAPEWVTTLMTTVCGLACMGGPFTCVPCLSLNAGIYAGTVAACAQKCPS